MRITNTLSAIDELSFHTLMGELGKQKFRLSLKEEDEWEEYYNEHRATCQKLSEKAAETEREIDTLVCRLYGLSDEENIFVEQEGIPCVSDKD